MITKANIIKAVLVIITNLSFTKAFDKRASPTAIFTKEIKAKRKFSLG